MGEETRAGTATSIDELLHLACDLLMGLGAFVVTLTGAVRCVVCASMPPDDGLRRIGVLARNCLAHPSAHDHRLFWNAELSSEADSADRSLACVVAPVWAADTQVGLLGVVDTWLPEPGEDERAGLLALAETLARLALAETEGSEPTGLVSTGLLDGSPRSEPPSVGDAGREDGSDVWRAVLDALPDALVVTAGTGKVTMANAAFCRLTGHHAGDLAGMHLDKLLVPDAFGPDRFAPGAGGSAQHPSTERRLLATAADEHIAVVVRNERVRAPAGVACTVTLVRRAGPSASALGTPIEAVELAAHLDDGVVCLDANGTVVLSNRAADAFYGLPCDRSLVGSTLPLSGSMRTEDGEVVSADQHPALCSLRDGTPYSARIVVGDADADRRHVAVRARPFPVGDAVGVLVVMQDITDMWEERQRLTHFALHDPLTGLANRYLLLEELRRMMQGLARRGGSVTLVFLDLDDFKHINDHHGHDVGDEVLAAVARRLQGAVRADDVVARLGGDEFVIAHAGAEAVPDGDLIVSRLRKVLSAPVRLHGRAFDVGASIGWVSTESDEVDPEALLAKADRAMYRHKRDRSLARHRAS